MQHTNIAAVLRLLEVIPKLLDSAKRGIARSSVEVVATIERITD